MKLLNSIGKKIFSIVLLSLATVLLLVFVSLSFFSKIGEIGGIKESASRYEILVKNASIEFEKFSQNGNEKHYENAVADITGIARLDGQIGILHSFLNEGKTPEEAVDLCIQLTGDHDPNLKNAANLVHSLMGTELMSRLVGITEKAHVLTTEWKQNLLDYQKETDPEAREKVLARIREIEEQIPPMLDTFHGVMGEVADYFSGKIRSLFLIICIVAILLISSIAFLISLSITRPLKQTVPFIKKVSEGNFMDNLTVNSNDELGIMVGNINEMSNSLREMIKEINSGVSKLSSSSGTLNDLSSQVSKSAEDNSEKATAVSRSAVEMTENMNAVAGAMGKSSENINTVAGAVEEMNSTINEIAKNADHGRSITEEAVEKVHESTQMMNALTEAASEIGNVVETITDISDQVNLLSLNATIEAARAGEAGRGFAVVANEIKDLAKQTSDASLDIKDKILNIQASSSGSLSSIEKISVVISEVNNIVATIATAVEEQSIATSEIAKNIALASNGIEEVSQNVGQSSMVVADISKAIGHVSLSTNAITEKSAEVKLSSKELSELAVHLDEMVSRFKV